MTMTGRFVNDGIRILAAVALLIAVMSSPIRPAKASQTALCPRSLPRNFAMLKIELTGRSMEEADSLQSDLEDELDADLEDELTVTSPPASGAFDVLPSPSPKPYSQLVDFAVALAARPLRC
jgi:hypothetical protein